MNSEQNQFIGIAEISKKLSISTRAIRFYEDQGLVHPKKNPHNAYRLFSETDVVRIQTIVILREMGMSLTDIRVVLDEMDRSRTDTVAHYLEMQRSVLYTKWIELSHTIRSTEYIIDSFDKNGRLADKELMTMSGGLKRLQEIRETTHTHWDFDANATSFDERVLTVTDPWAPYSGYDHVLNSIVEYVCPNEGESGLELAIGTGNLSNKFAAKGAEMSGVDQSFEMLRQCRTKYPRIRTKLGNMMAAPFFDGQFNFVVTSYAFHLLTNEQQLLSLREMDRLTVNGGRVCIADHMFLEDRDRLATMERLKRDGNDKAIESIEQHNFANLSNLISWLVQHSYTPKTIRINESVYLLLAYKEKSY